MNKVRVISRIDIKNEFVIKGIQLEGLRKLGNPNEFAKRYYEDGVDEILFVDVVASYYDRNSLIGIIEKSTKDIFIPITVCGGIRTLNDVEKILSNGADKIAVNTAAIKNPKFLFECANMIGSQSVVLSIEAKQCNNDWIAYYDNGRESSEKKVIEWIKEAQDLGVGEILLTSIDKDGTMRGMDINLIEKISKIVDIPLIISGGVGKLEHMLFVKDNNKINAIALGSSLHYNKLNIKNVKNYISNLSIIINDN